MSVFGQSSVLRRSLWTGLCLLTLFGLTVFLSGCSQEPVVPGDRLQLCQSDSDCESGWICILNACQIRLSANSRQDGGIVILPDLFKQDKPPVDKDPTEQPPTDETKPDQPPVDKDPAGCRSTADCKEPLLCNTQTNQCVQCLRTPDCNGQLCKNNKCVPCKNDNECPVGQACLQQKCASVQCSARQPCSDGKLCKNYLCVACKQNAECGQGRICLQQKCVAGECTQEGDCKAGQLCKNNKCVGCQTNADCGLGRICSANLCKPGQCTQESDCKAGLLCKNNQCVNCAADGDCGAGRLCLSRFCKPGVCRTNNECQNGQVCKNNQCVACTDTSECESGQLCLSGVCKVGNCVKTDDCQGGLICKNNQCTACQADGECGGLLCLGGVCKAGCRASSDCKSPVGQVCKANACVNCTAASECKTGEVCDNGLCKQPQCLRNSDCPAGKVCKSGGCGPCIDNADCGGSTCSNGVCKIGVVSIQDAKRWADKTFAESCEGYMKPADPAKYEGVPAAGAGVYWIQPKGQTSAFKVLCVFDKSFFGGGWTLVLKLDGGRSTFKYSSALWTNSNTLSPTALKLDGTEAKFASFHTMPFKELMLWYATASKVGAARIEATGTSLLSIFKGGKNQKFKKNLGRSNWTRLLDNGSMQRHCSREGFNVHADGSIGAVKKVRLGIMFNDFDSCLTPDTFVGIGNDGSPSAGGRRTQGIGTRAVARISFLFLR